MFSPRPFKLKSRGLGAARGFYFWFLALFHRQTLGIKIKIAKKPKIKISARGICHGFLLLSVCYNCYKFLI